MATQTSEKAVGEAVGNALSLNVAERALGRLLDAANLVKVPTDDFWGRVTPNLPDRDVRASFFQYDVLPTVLD